MKRPSLWLACLLLFPALTAGEANAGAAAEDEATAPQQEDANALLGGYARRIREAIEPEDVRRACNAPTGSYAANETITVCGEALGQNRYRVPREVAVAPKEEDMMSPVARGRALMNTGNGPQGNAGDLVKPQGNPLLLGIYTYKFFEKLIEDVQQEE